MFYPPPDAPDIPEETTTTETVDKEEVVDDLQSHGLTYTDFGSEYGLSKNEASTLLDELRVQGHDIDYKEGSNSTRLWYIPEDRDQWYQAGDGEGTYRFALMSDTHLGSQAEHLEELHDFYDRLQERGIDTVYHAGDISDGWDVHQGHLNVIKGEAAGWSRLLEYVVEHYPQREGIDTYFIEGNHDHKYHRRNGVHFGELIDRRRKDLHYCGDSQARFIFDADAEIDMELIHPAGGQPYTKGYRAQTLYRERPAEERPSIAGIGHLHGKLYAEAEDVEAFYTGCWKGLTTYGKRKGHDSEIGGWVVEMAIEDGEIRSVVPEWIGYESRDQTVAYDADDLDEMSGW